jgi:hypothetical protein
LVKKYFQPLECENQCDQGAAEDHEVVGKLTFNY